MAWMIMLAKEQDIGRGCASCRFLLDGKCMADERVSVFRDGEIDTHRPYCCPFRYYDKEIRPITSKFDKMTVEETKGWFEGMDFDHKRYIRLEEERSRYADYKRSEIDDD